MNCKTARSSSPSSPRSAFSVDNESTVSDTFSFAPDGGYQLVIYKDDSVPATQGPIKGPSRLIPRKSEERDTGSECLEFEHRNGNGRLRNGDSQNGTTQSHHFDDKRHLDNENIHVEGEDIPLRPGTGFASPSKQKDQLTTRSEPVLTGAPTVQNPSHRKPAHTVSPENGLHETGSRGIVGEQALKLQVEAPIPIIGRSERPPKRQLLATSSAPVRLARSELKALHQHQSDPEGHDDGSDGSSPQSSKSDMQSMSDYTGGVTCASERSLVRTKSMPSRSFSEVEEMNEYWRSNTQSGGRRMRYRNKENLNVRLVVPEKLSDRKKKKLMREIATIQQDGTVEFDVAGSARIASNLFGPGIFDEGGEVGEEDVADDDEKELRNVPPLQIVMLIVGTRGDVQPFIAIGKHLQEYGHRVRLATHTNFREFVMTAGLEFYPLGGDPKVLAGYMVKNKGFLPSGPGEIQVQRKQIKAIINSLLPACVETDTESGSTVPFKAQAIIANPPAYGHVHVAEHLQVPLHIFFTMPWTATSQFPHPLSRVKSPAGYRMSYQVVDSLIWWGIRSMINDFRKKKLKLRPITYFSGSQGSIAELPTGYIWSPHLVPKPRDWGPLVDVVGFCFLNLAQDYKPPKDLMQWLKAGPAPIYIGFGSLPVVDPKGMTDIIVKALKATHQRGIIFKGWGGMGELQKVPDNVFLIEDCPHDWLFKQCAAVVHHGGAGTTAAGLKAACPTTVVPFFGDQPFWGEQIHAKGVGPPPIAVDQFSLEKLVKAIEYMLKDEVKQRATEIATAMENEDGVEGAVVAFHKHLPQDTPELVNTHPPDKSRFKMFKPLKNVYSCFL